MLAMLPLAACSPALNWREVRPPGAALKLMFPCKPEHEDRAQPGPGGRTLTVRTLSCQAQGGQFSLTWVDLGAEAEVPAAMARWREGVAHVLAPGASAPLAIAGLGGSAPAVQQQWLSREGQPAARQAVFAQGTRVYQLLLQAQKPNPDAWETFLGSVAAGG